MRAKRHKQKVGNIDRKWKRLVFSKYPPRISAQAKRYPNWEVPWVCSAPPGKFRDSIKSDYDRFLHHPF